MDALATFAEVAARNRMSVLVLAGDASGILQLTYRNGEDHVVRSVVARSMRGNPSLHKLLTDALGDARVGKVEAIQDIMDRYEKI